MTTATPPSPSTREGDEADPITTLVEAETRRPKPVRSRWWRVGYPMALVVLLFAIPALVFAGLRVILDSNDGQLVRRVTDPAAPGYEAVVEKTPTQLVVGTRPDGTLDTLTVLALTSDGIGGVMTVPATTTVTIAGAPLSLAFLHDTSGVEPMVEALSNLIDVALTDVQVVPATEWAEHLAAVGSITVDSPDAVTDARGAVVFPRGEVVLAPDQVATYLAGRGPRESDLNRMLRIQAFWEAWFEALETKGVGAVPQPVELGLGRFLSTLADDDVVFETLPVKPTAASSTGVEQFVVDEEAAPAAIARIIPFAEGPPGGRPRLRVLDGTGQLDNGVSAAITLSAAGAQVDVVGNAREFGETTTQFVYYEEGMEAEAQRLRDALGVGEIVLSEQTNAATDLTVVLGDDYLAIVGADPSVAATPGVMSVPGG